MDWFFSRAAGAIFGFLAAGTFHGEPLLGAVAGMALAMMLDFTLDKVLKEK